MYTVHDIDGEVIVSFDDPVDALQAMRRLYPQARQTRNAEGKVLSDARLATSPKHFALPPPGGHRRERRRL